MRKRLVAFVFFPLVLAILLSLASPAFGLYYCYNYGVNWNQSPFWLSMDDASASGQAAALYQNARSSNYYGKWYTNTWSADVWTNMHAAHIVYTVSHAAAGVQIYYGLPTRTGSDGLPTNMSCYRSTSTPLIHNHYPGTSSKYQRCNSIRDANAASSTGVRLAVFEGCNTGTKPPVAANSVAYATWDAVVPCACAVGFTSSIGGTPGITKAWATSFWSDLSGGWSVGNAMDRAQAAVTRYAGGPCGYQNHVGVGNPAMVLYQ